jgi:tetratricopeptide (TPR) repeat protein
MQRAEAVGSGAQGPDATYYYVQHLQAWSLRRQQGRLAELEASIERYTEEYPGTFLFRCVLASVHADLGREQRARDELDHLAAHDFTDLDLEPEWFLGASLLAEVCARLEDADRAEALYPVLLPYAECNVYASPEVALGSAARPLGLLAATVSRWDDAERLFELALEMNVGMGARPWVAHTQHDHARMLIRRGAPKDESRAGELLQAARHDYKQLGMTGWVESASAELTALN